MDEDGAPERVGRLLGRLVVRGRAAARRAAEPESQERVREAYRALSERARPAAEAARRTWVERGPDIAEAAADRAVDGALGAVGLRFPFLRTVLRPLADGVREGARSHARRLASPPPGPVEEPSPPDQEERPAPPT